MGTGMAYKLNAQKLASTYRTRYLIITIGVTVGLIVYTLWFAVNSDNDNVHPYLNQLIPAGHCACKTTAQFQCSSCLSCPSTTLATSSPESRPYNARYDAKNLTLPAAQCQSFFPGLFEDIHRARAFWQARNGIAMDDLDDINLLNGMARVAILQGELHVLAIRAKGEDHRRKIIATLSSIHRALVASPDSMAIPNTEFVFSIEDKLDDVAGPDHPLWILARRPSEESVWLIPDFGLWAWSNGNVDNQIGPYDRIADRIRHDEQTLSWGAKEDKLVWRGKLSFAPKMRRSLLEVSRNQPWGDVKELVWQNKENYLSMEDHCRYKFIAHVEGRSYSASLKYRQACKSVIFAHRLQFIQHHHYLMIPSGPNQNYVEVERDFSDLPEKVEYLLTDPRQAERIASNSVNTFRERYLTPAAEACYWRALIDGWTGVSRNITTSLGRTEKGMRYESFILLDSSDMLRFTA
ncbi:hypothetical protein ASPWEDRAFT_45718 [Aspergillus wentii DTO 134E9]|uniref:Glycosyl transferase CAP10 domain-containing protein n=1 Tax=Aspergillus wentii DTO 134E9 TaxID=1073089 RepID=A0A1L9R5F3_ASPWE|nr:uncharacterized protein ASPWEDRAFT_45718 [Aspergillus wentii DTO 134E9]KAI9925355.1 hypothetical protein MW887_006283 [Aspergillus wentii]OJJ30150.1 hypothetical protein ASPWEDRAFT_45718 [Aspergillus wentii DTO 134E9]